MIVSKHAAKPLFDIHKKQVEVKQEIKKAITEGFESIHDPEASSDRFVLINHNTGERFACKFYNEDRDDFVGASMLAMYNLKEHFDRSVINGNNITNYRG